jgi:hypothetical protein
MNMGTLKGFAAPSAPPPSLREASPNPAAMLRCQRSWQAPHAPIPAPTPC